MTKNFPNNQIYPPNQIFVDKYVFIYIFTINGKLYDYRKLNYGIFPTARYISTQMRR